MITKILIKELKEILAGQRFRWLAIGLSILWTIGLLNGISYYTEQVQIHGEATQASYRQWLEQGEKNPHAAAHYGFYTFKPIMPASILEKGASDFMGNAIWLEAHNQNEVKNPAASDHGTLSRMGQLTVGFLMVYIFPLLIFLLSYNTFSREWENGTIRILLSTRAGMPSLFIGKLLGTFTATMLVFLPLWALAWLVSAWVAKDAPHIGHLWEIAVPMTITALVFYLILSLLGVTLSLWTRQSAVSLILITGFWLVGVFLVPRLSAALARYHQPLPSSFVFDQQIATLRENGIDGHNPSGARQAQLVKETLEKYGVQTLAELPVNFAAISLQASEEFDAAIYDKVYGNSFAQMMQQNEFLQKTFLLSPFMAFRNWCMALSHTDMATHLHFANEAETHRRMIQKALNTFYENNQVGNETLWASIPPFEYQPLSLTERVSGVTNDLLSIGFWLFIAAIAALFTVLHFKNI
jgi:ABC-2 type transport system permease protein